MPIIHKKKAKKEVPFQERDDLKKLVLHITIIPSSIGQMINKLFKSLGVACQFTQRGKGTASKKVREILGVEDNNKDIIISLIPEQMIPILNRELEALFVANEKNKGVAFTVPMESIISVRVYNFLADML